MKLTNIFLTLTMIAGMMFSCVSEDIVGPYSGGDEDVIDGLPTTLSIKLSPGKILTKATGEAATPYEYASPDELFVGEAAVAIFDVEGGVPTTLKAFKYVTNPAKTSTAADTLAWEITGIRVTTGLAHILVVANLPESKMNQAYPITEGTTTYTEYKELIASENFDNSFDSKTLVKVGELRTTLSTDNKVIEIPMIQLAAKVTFTFKVNIAPLTDTTRFEPTKETLDIFELFNKGNIQSAQVDSKYDPGVTTWPSPYDANTPVVYYAFNCKQPGVPGHFNAKQEEIVDPFTNIKRFIKTNSADAKVIELGMLRSDGTVKGLTVDSVVTKTVWKLHINAISVNNIQTKTDVLIEGFNKQLPTVSTNPAVADWEDTEVNNIQYITEYPITFYTYERAAASNDITPLKINANSRRENSKTIPCHNARSMGNKRYR